MAEKRYDTTTFWRILLPIFALIVLLIAIWMLFTTPGWVSGVPTLYPASLKPARANY